jgi:hypothetical protein
LLSATIAVPPTMFPAVTDPSQPRNRPNGSDPSMTPDSACDVVETQWSRLDDGGGQRAALGHQQREQERAGDVRRPDHRPEPQRRSQVAAVVEHQRRRVQGGLGEQLRAPDDRRDEADRVERRRDEVGAAAPGERAEDGRRSQAAEADGRAGEQPGEHQCRNGPFELLVGVALDARVDVLRAWAHAPAHTLAYPRAPFLMG